MLSILKQRKVKCIQLSHYQMMKQKLKNKKIKSKIVLLRVSLFLLFALVVLQLDAQQITWKEIYPGVWKGVVGKPENYDLLKASGAQANVDALNKIGKTSFPLSQSDINGELQDGKTFL